MRVEACVGGLRFVLFLPETRERHDDEVVAEVAANAATRLVSIHARHVDVEQHDVGAIGQHLAEPAVAVICGPAFSPKLLDQHRHHHRGVAVVVDDHYPAVHRVPVARKWRASPRDLRGHRQPDDELAPVSGSLAA